MIRQGSIVRFTEWNHANDIRFRVVRVDGDIVHLQSTRALVDCTLERLVFYSWLRNKVLTLEVK